MLICVAVWNLQPDKKWVLAAFIFTVPLNIALQFGWPDLNYFVRAFVVIVTGLGIALGGSRTPLKSLVALFQSGGPWQSRGGWALALSLLVLHFIFH